MDFQIWSIQIHWAPGATDLEIEQLQEAGVTKLQENCPHIELGLVDVHYGPIRDQPEYDEEGNVIPLNAIYQELKVECVYCATEENDGMG
jgi:hypothetical protein